MSAFAFRLEQVDGTPADPPTVSVSVPNMQPGDTISLGGGRSLRVVQSPGRRSQRFRSWSPRSVVWSPSDVDGEAYSWPLSQRPSRLSPSRCS